MGESLRYNMQHIGDIFVDRLEKAFGCLKTSTRGIGLTVEIHDLEQKRGKTLRKIGTRIAEVRSRSPELDVFGDTELAELFSRLDNLEERIDACKRERDERLYPGRRPVERYETS